MSVFAGQGRFGGTETGRFCGKMLGNKTAPRHRANGVIPRGLADWIGVD